MLTTDDRENLEKFSELFPVHYSFSRLFFCATYVARKSHRFVCTIPPARFSLKRQINDFHT